MIFGIKNHKWYFQIVSNYVQQFRNITSGIYAKYHYKSCHYLYKFTSLGHFPYITFCMIMLFRKPCHMPFHKLIPLFTLTGWNIPIRNEHFHTYSIQGWDKNRKRKVPCTNSVRFTQLWSNILSFENIFFLNHRKRFHQKLEFSAISLSLFTYSSFY